MKRLCILMPVYSNPDRVRYTLDRIIPPCEKNEIDIILCDGCADDAILRMYHGYSSNHLIHMDKRANPTRKIYEAFEELKSEYAYIWLIGDSIVLRLEKLIGDIQEYMSRKFDIIHFCEEKNDEIPFGTRIEYTDAMEFYRNDIWYLTCYGATILASSFIENTDWYGNIERYTESFTYVMSIISNCASREFRAIHIQREYKDSNPLRLANGSVLNGEALQIYGYNWIHANRSLPPVFDEYKEEAILSLDRHIHFFSFRNSLRVSAYGNFTLAKVRQFRREIPQVTTTPVWCFYLIALLPRKLIIRLRKIKAWMNAKVGK